MSPRYDLVVIGSGAAATTAATQVRAAGRRVAVVDQRPLGGTCALRGYDPKKVLIAAAAAVDRARKLRDKGIHDSGLRIEWPALMAFKRTFTDPVPPQKRASFEDEGIDTYRGTARFVSPNALAVGDDRLEARHILIAAGAKPAALGIEGQEHVSTSDDFLELEQLPRRIVFIGGGFIALELAHVAARAGAEVRVLEQGARILSPFDSDLAEQLADATRALGVDVRLCAAVERIERRHGGCRVQVSEDGATHHVDAQLVVHGAGRVPALDALDLAAGEVAHKDGRLELNEFLQSESNPAVYAAGDAAQVGPPLTPVASRDGAIAAANILEGNRAKAEYGAVPSVVFTLPPLAAVGLREDEAERRGLDVRVSRGRTADWYTSRRANETAAGYKILIEKGSDRILGAHLLGPHADELINVFALALRTRLSTKDLDDVLFAYPTGASDVSHML